MSARSITHPAPTGSSPWPRLVFAPACAVAVAVGVVLFQHVRTSTRADHLGSIAGLLAVVSLASTVAYLVILAVLHAVPTGYSPVRHAVSDYGVGRYRWLFTLALYVSSVGVFTLALALTSGVGAPPLSARDLGFLLVIPLARIGMTLFPTDLEGRRISRTGVLHYAFAVAAFTLTYLAISGLTPALRAFDLSEWLRAPLSWANWAVGPGLALLVITMLRPLRRVFGLFERIFLLTTNLWFALAALLVISRLT